MDIRIENAVRLDWQTGTEIPCTVDISDGKIEKIWDMDSSGAAQRQIAGGRRDDSLEKMAEKRIDARGAVLTPGLIDFHTHLFTGGSAFGVNADLLLGSGTTLAVDMGTAGSSSYEAFHYGDVLPRTMPVKAFLNLSPVGQPGSGISEPLGSGAIWEEQMEKLIRRYPSEILGIKVRLSKEIVGEEGVRPLQHAVRLGEIFGLPVCVHTTNPPVPAEEVVGELRPGDIYSHMYHNKGYTILDERGMVSPAFWEAKKRGVFLEVGNGRMNFHFDVAKAAIEQGLFPDIISSDATARTFGNSPDMKDLVFVMSKFWNMGMPLERVIEAVTKTPAKALSLSDEYGVLEEGRPAHLTLLRKTERPVQFSDSAGNCLEGTKFLAPEMTMIGGRILYLQGESILTK